MRSTKTFFIEVGEKERDSEEPGGVRQARSFASTQIKLAIGGSKNVTEVDKFSGFVEILCFVLHQEPILSPPSSVLVSLSMLTLE